MPDPEERKPAKEPDRCPLKEIVNHRPAFEVPEVDIVVAPGQQAGGGNIQLGMHKE